MTTKVLNIACLFLLSALQTAGLSSCANVTYPIEEPEPTDVYYMSFRVQTAAQEDIDADAPEYVDGTEFEHAVDFSGNSENVVIYLDEDYKYKSYALLEFDRLSAQGTPAAGEAEEISYIGFIRPDYHEAYILPKYGMIILNAYKITRALKELEQTPGATINDVLGLLDTSDNGHIAGRSGNYFTLTSSAYLVRESNNWKHSVIFEIDRDKIFSTRAQAVIQPAAVAYVERMASKFSLTLPGATGGKGVNFVPDDGRAQVIVCRYINGEPNYSNRSWTCSVDAWGINKYEPCEYYFRNIVPETVDTQVYPYDFGTDINSAGRPFFYGWNRTVDRRCFWAIDPNYTTGIYPAQYRPAVDNTGIDYYGKRGPASLAYLSYNTLSKDLSRVNEEEGAILYSTENTFPDTHLGGLWQHDLAGSELVVGARIHIKNVDETKTDYDLYRNRIGVFYPSKTDFAYYFINTFNDQLKSQSTMSYRYYDWDNPDSNSTNDIHTQKISFPDYKLYYKDAPLTPQVMVSLMKNSMPALIENGDGKVIPWIQGMYIGRRAKDPNTYEEIGEVMKMNITDNDFKSLIYDWIGAFDHFNQGRMIYTVPILYRGTKEKVTANTYRPVVGDYGVVRNAWYSFKVHSIDNLGSPVDDLDQPIIPYETSLENSIMMELKVFDWHEFSTDVIFPSK